MKQPHKATLLHCRGMWPAALIISLILCPTSSHAAVEEGSVRLSIINYLFLAITLMSSLVMFFIFQRRFRNTNRELQDITAELSTTRKRLNESNKELEFTQQDLKTTTHRYQGMLFNAAVGMFQIDLRGKCTYVNTAMQQMTGQHQKRAEQEGLAAAVDMNPSYMGTQFKLYNGITISEYINNRRIEEAITLLQQGKMKIIDIAFSVGFENIVSFNRVFKRITGKTPSEYRKNR